MNYVNLLWFNPISGELNYETNRDELKNICPLLEKNEYIREDSIQFWYKDFLTYYDNQTQPNDSQSFMSHVGRFLIINNNYLQDVKMNISYLDEDLAEKLEMGDFLITVNSPNSFVLLLTLLY